MSTMDLEAIEEIKRLKYRYFRGLDTKDWETFADTLATDIRARYGTKTTEEALNFDTREDVVAFMSENLPARVLSTHVAGHPEIDVDGDTATASWVFEDTVIALDLKIMVRGSGYYRDEYRRDDNGRWRISATSYRRMYEFMTSLEDVPSFALLAPEGL